MRFRNLIFDLDGTLVDSFAGIEESVKAAMASVFPQREMPDLKPLVGPPLRTMFSRLWPEIAEKQLDELLGEFRRHYDGEGCLKSRPYDEAGLVLESLKGQGLNLFLLTNKPDLPTRKILSVLGWSGHFTAVYSPDGKGQTFGTKADGAGLLMQAHSIPATSACLIGDSLDDALAARAWGLPFFAANYGYGQAAIQSEYPAYAEIKSLSHLRDILLKQGKTLP